MSVTYHLRSDQETSFIGGNELYILSIDVGRVNFGIRISSRKIDTNGNIKMKTLIMSKLSFEQKKSVNSNFYSTLSSMLHELKYYVKKCDYFLIEKQMNKNTNAIRDMQFYITYFMMLRYAKRSSLVVEVSPKIKSKYYNCPKHNGKKLSGKKLKQWNIEISKEICDHYGDKKALKIMTKTEKYTKIDELGDIICMEDGFIKHVKSLSKFQSY